MPAWNDYKDEAKSRGALAMELFVVTTKPCGDMELVKKTLPDHLKYQKQLEAGGALVMAGPVSDASGEQMNAEGMIIYRAENLAAARVLADADPMHHSYKFNQSCAGCFRGPELLGQSARSCSAAMR